MQIEGRSWRFGRNINTDLIYPKIHFRASYEPGEMASHLMSGFDEGFAARVRPGDIIVAEANFGCGSSREEAAAAMKEAGIAAVVAPSFGRLFMRNCINLGVPVVVSPGIEAAVNEGNVLAIDLEAGTLVNRTTGYETRIPPVAEESLMLIRDGGIRAYTRRILEQRARAASGQ